MLELEPTVMVMCGNRVTDERFRLLSVLLPRLRFGDI
jgi:hypothetical protein